MPDEEAFSLLVRLMSVYDLQGHFLPEMPKLQLRLVSFEEFLKRTDDLIQSSLVPSRQFKQGLYPNSFIHLVRSTY